MNIFDIDLNKILPYAIEAYTNIYGIEYKEDIIDKVNNTIILPYYGNLNLYITNMKVNKSRELSVKFMNLIGKNIDIKEFNNKFDEKSELMISNYLGCPDYTFEHSVNSIPLFSFEKNKYTAIRLINSILNINIDENNYIEFTKTKEYTDFLNKIEEMKKIFYIVRNEYLSWKEKDIYSYEKYIDEEENREKKYKVDAQEFILNHNYNGQEKDIIDRFKEKFLINNKYIDKCLSLLNNEEDKNIFISAVKRDTTCAWSTNNHSFIAFNIASFSGNILRTLLHELNHAITTFNNTIGLDIEKDIKNEFIKRYRIYERFNEAITDIYAEEAFCYITTKYGYLIEDESITLKNDPNINIGKKTKEIIMPFINKYKSAIDKSLMYSNPEYLTEVIGKDNYELLIYYVNEMDYLEKDYLQKLLYSNSSNLKVDGYNELLEKINTLYKNMECKRKIK